MNLFNKSLLLALSAVFLVACGQPLSPSLPKKSSGSSLNAVQRPQGVSPDCTSWFDGCNTCSLQMNGQAACTYKACQNYAQPYCLNQVNGGTGSTIQRPAGIPVNCMSWNDGCNDCSVVNNNMGCTYKTCTNYGTPYCKN